MGWAGERKPVQTTIYEWTQVTRQFTDFIGHDDASRISSDDTGDLEPLAVANRAIDYRQLVKPACSH